MATKAVAAAPEAISEESAKTHLADRQTEAQAVALTTHADGTTAGNAPIVAGEPQHDAGHISPASADNIRSQAVAAAPDHPENSSPLGIKIEGATSIKLGNSELLYAESRVLHPEKWFARLRDEIPWSPERVLMYGKPLVLERQTCNFGDDYDYNKLAKPAVPWGGPVLELKKMLEGQTGHVFTQCACNLYPDGETGIGLHHDKRHPLLVASISFGAVRTIGFAAKGGKLDKSLPMIPLASGSVLLFTDAINENFKHTIIEDKSVRGPRISVTFREFPTDPTPKAAKKKAPVAPQQKSQASETNASASQPLVHDTAVSEVATLRPSIGAAPARPENGLGSLPVAEVLPPQRDSVTPAPLSPEVPYVFADLDDQTFHKTLSDFVQQAQGQYAEFGLTLYYRILPGLQDAQRRFKEHEEDSDYRLDGCAGIEQYIKKLGLTPARVRKWRQRDKERQFTREVKLLVGGAATCPECGKGKGHAPSCSQYVPPPPPPPESESEAKILAEQCLRMTNTLLGPSRDLFPERVKKVIRMAQSVQEAAAGGKYENADFAAPLYSPEPQRESVPAEPDPGSLNDLGRRISCMADTNDIGPAVQTYIDLLFKPLREGGLVLTFQVSARRDGRGRIDLGDWVESTPYRAGTTERHVGRVVDRDKLHRPIIRWFETGEWQKPRSQFANSDYGVHVLSAEEARDKYPDAFACYRLSKAEMERPLAKLSAQSAPAEQEKSAAHQAESLESEAPRGNLQTKVGL